MDTQELYELLNEHLTLKAIKKTIQTADGEFETVITDVEVYFNGEYITETE